MTTAFEDVYRDHLPAIWRYVRARVADQDRAQDVCAEVFARACGAWASYDPSRGTVGAWLGAIARHTVVDWLRRTGPRRSMREEAAGDLPEPPAAYVAAQAGPDDRLIEEELLALLRAEVARLSEREQEALALRFGAELSAAEVGQAMGVSEGAAKMLVHRAVVKLRKVMSRDG